MSVFLRLCCSLVVLAPSLVLAATLETPGNGDNLSGIGVIRGWKCEAVGDITVVIDGGAPLLMAYGNDRLDTESTCGDRQNGFVSIYNWGELSTGEHTALAYDNGVEFARSTFTVVRPSEEEPYLRDVTAECTVPDFPDPGTNASFEWNQGTQHLELAEVGEDVVVPVSTQFDGEWDISFIADGVSEIGGERCDCFPTIESPGTFSIAIEDGYIFFEGYDCSSGEETLWYAVISSYGGLESSYGQWRETSNGDPFFLSRGSFDGSLSSDDGTGRGRWFNIYGCGGEWLAQRREDS